MKTKIGVLGSCVSRDAFNSNFVHNYKEFFDVKISAQRTSLISVMQEPIPIDNKLIFNDNTLVWHNEPYIFQKEVKDSEIINMYLEWLPFNSMSVYKK